MSFPTFGQIFGSRFARAFGSRGGSNIASLYRLLDQFNTPRSAGAINGTQAEPTGQARTVTDTNSKLSISGGVASFATGGAGNADPGLWWTIQTRTTGKALLALLNVTSTNCGFGWFPAQTGAGAFSLRIQSGALALRDAGIAIASVGVTALSTDYQVALILRSIGCWY